MRRPLLLALALSAAAAAHARAQTAAPPPPDPPRVKVVVEQPAAPATKAQPLQSLADETFGAELKDVDGASFFLSDYRGRVFVINVWATWCGPCRLEIPELNRMRADYSARGVEFVGLTTENPKLDAERVRDFVREFEMRYKVGFADAETAKALLGGRYVIPQTFVVAADGRVVARFRGYSNAMPPAIRRAIEKALGRGAEPHAPAAQPRPSPPPAAPAEAPRTAAPPTKLSTPPALETLHAPGA